MGRDAIRRALPLALILLATTLVFGQILKHDLLAWDDDVNIAGNPLVTQGVIAGWREYRANPVTRAYPLSALMWGATGAVNRWMGRPSADPVAFHLLGLVLHLACVSLVWRLLACARSAAGNAGPPDTPRTASLWARIGATALFAWHPLQVETVAWATASKDSLAVLLCLLAMRSRQGGGELTRVRQLRALAWLMLAMLAKPTSGILAPALAVADWVGQGHSFDAGSLRRVWRAHRFWLLPAVLGLAWLKWTQPDRAMPYVPDIGLRLAGALDALAFYIRRLCLPVGLSAMYGRTPLYVAGLTLGMHALNFLLVGAFVTTGLLVGRRRAAAALAAGGMILLPALGLVPFHFQTNYSTVADRYLYLPAVAAAGLLMAILARRPGRYLIAARGGRVALVAVLSLTAVLAWRQTAHWRDSRLVFERVRQVARARSYGDPVLAEGMALVQLAAWENNHGRPGVAETLARQALTMQPLNREARIALAYALNGQGRFNETLALLATPTVAEPSDYWLCMARAIACLHLGNLPAVAENLDAALALRPFGPEARAMRERLGQVWTPP